MGDNQAFSIMEETVVGLYDLGVLSPEALTVVLRAYVGADIDEGGRLDLLAKDGLGVKEIVVKVFAGGLPPKGRSKVEYRSAVSAAFDDAVREFWS
jgi:hypothetical protein